ncbi:uncharacterized protein ACA1_063320 [Acanthamoeba castellanii str. Neff]|uniref:PIN domain-containing protein n=1 Tax=Acanthamoeba castellanii (strain ATCC 30010 / Neff) TaxID=1257118 RepID=L8GYG2_ACACF|nr:uncharacterized protein ACA1_063320 [Acanthamoeba castellanii str. Neff]ELR17568.1 hypothetical protein ACA1_063320 [Acanthamoeba castellanii str. Neff]
MSTTSFVSPPPCAVCMRHCHGQRIVLGYDPARNIQLFACCSDCEGRWRGSPSTLTSMVVPHHQPPAKSVVDFTSPSFRINPAIVSPPLFQSQHVQHQLQQLKQLRKNQSASSKPHSPPRRLSNNKKRDSPPREVPPNDRSAASARNSHTANTIRARVEQTQRGMKMTPQLAEQLKSACFVVIDTNAWITSLDAVLSLKNYPHLTVIVPSAVVQELDGLKQDQGKDQLGSKARLAIKVIYDATAGGEQWIRGQRYDEHLGAALKIDNRDDEILSCALFFHTKVSPSVLITGDYGLALKCNINRVPTTDMRGLLECLPATSMSTSAPATHSRPTQPTATAAAKRKAADRQEPTNTATTMTAVAMPTKRRRTSAPVDIPGFCFSSSPQNSDNEDDDEPERQEAMQVQTREEELPQQPQQQQEEAEAVATGLRRLLSPDEDDEERGRSTSAHIWSAALRRSHNRTTFGRHRHPKHWYLAWRRSVCPPQDFSDSWAQPLQSV